MSAANGQGSLLGNVTYFSASAWLIRERSWTPLDVA